MASYTNVCPPPLTSSIPLPFPFPFSSTPQLFKIITFRFLSRVSGTSEYPLRRLPCCLVVVISFLEFCHLLYPFLKSMLLYVPYSSSFYFPLRFGVYSYRFIVSLYVYFVELCLFFVPWLCVCFMPFLSSSVPYYFGILFLHCTCTHVSNYLELQTAGTFITACSEFENQNSRSLLTILSSLRPKKFTVRFVVSTFGATWIVKFPINLCVLCISSVFLM